MSKYFQNSSPDLKISEALPGHGHGNHIKQWLCRVINELINGGKEDSGGSEISWKSAQALESNIFAESCMKMKEIGPMGAGP